MLCKVISLVLNIYKKRDDGSEYISGKQREKDHDFDFSKMKCTLIK